MGELPPVPTPTQLREMADRADAEAEISETQAKALREQAAELRRLADLSDAIGERGLHKRSQKASVNAMETSHRVAISAAAAPKDKFLKAIREAGYTLTSLAGALEIAASTLHAHRVKEGETNSRPIPEDRAKRVEELTGWKATRANWPAGIS